MTEERQSSILQSARTIYRLMSPQRRRHFWLALFLMLLGGVAELLTIGAIIPFLALLVGSAETEKFPWLGDVLAMFGATTYAQQLVSTALLFMGAAVLAAIFRLLLAWTTQSFALMLGHELSVEVQRRVLYQPYSYHIGHSSSEIVASLDKVQILVFSIVIQGMQATAGVVISLFIMGALMQVDLFTVAVASGSFALIYGIWAFAIRLELDRYSQIAGSGYEERVRMVQEGMGGVRDILLDHSQREYLRSFAEIDYEFSRARARATFLSISPRFIIEAFGMILLAALALVIAGREGGLAYALPVLGAFALGAQRMLPLLQQLYQGWTSFASNRAIVGQVLAYLDLPVEEELLAEKIDPLPFDERIEIDNLSFHHPGRSQPTLEGVTLTIPRGARVAFVGPTGSGKSTLADLVMGLLQPSSGEIRIDGVPLSKANRSAWQQNVSHVPQHVFLSDTSIARNIAFGVRTSDIDQGRVENAARLTQIDAFIRTLPQAYETRVGERGVRLSGGQRQRLAIARAIYKQAPVIVLDEATSALDKVTEDAVITAVDQLGERGRTIIIIAHNPNVIRHCDIVARLDRGRVVEVGSVEEVLGKNPNDAG